MIRKIFTLTIFIATLTATSQAQEASVASGGQAVGSGGSVSFSVGQTFYIDQSSATSSITPGVQQPYHITWLSNPDRDVFPIELNVFPNPASDNLNITVAGPDTENIVCKIYDLLGNHLETFPIEAGSSQINIGHLTNAIYLFAIAQGNQTIQTYKIVKTH